MKRRFQFSLSDVFRWTLVVALVVGAWIGYAQLVAEKQRDAREQAIDAGRLKPEGH
jgi:hypothetical protein